MHRGNQTQMRRETTKAAEIASRYTLKQHLLYEARTCRTVVSTLIY